MKTILILFLVFLGEITYSQNIIFNDTIFKFRLINNGIDTNSDGEISLTEAAAITTLDVSYGWNFNPITDLTGIEYFINIDSLNCSGNDLVTINLSSNINLKYLDCYGSYLVSLNLSNNSNLKYLECSENYYLDTLVLGNNLFLERIYLNHVYTNSIFDFSGLPNLKILEFSHATDLDMTYNNNLRILSCRFSHGVINVSNNPNLDTLICQGQSNLNVLNCPQLKYLQCVGNNIKLDSIDLSNNHVLARLDLWLNNLSYIDLSNDTALQFIELGYNHIPYIDFTHNTHTTYISCGGDSLKSIDVTGLINLQALATGNFMDSTSSNLDNLDVTTNINLKHLYCPSGNLANINLSQNVFLEDLHCGFNNLDTIILCSSPNFNYLHCDGMPQLTHVFIMNVSNPPNYFIGESINMQFYSCSLLDIRTNKNTSNIFIYPNPVNQILKINDLTEFVNLTFEVIDFNSKIVLQNKLTDNFIDVKTISSGVYVLRILTTNSLIFQSQFIKE